MSRLIDGKMLDANLLRGGTDLAVETDLLYLDVTNGFVGIKNGAPSVALDVAGSLAVGGTSSSQVILPNHTTAAIGSIGTPSDGGTVFDSTTKELKYYNGTEWVNTSPALVGASTFTLAVSTVDATETAFPNTDGVLTLPDNTTWRFEVNIVARRTDVVGESAGYKFTGVISRDTTDSSTTIIGVVAEVIDAEIDASWYVTVEDLNIVEAKNGALNVYVNGAAAKNINWVAFVRTVEVSN